MAGRPATWPWPEALRVNGITSLNRPIKGGKIIGRSSSVEELALLFCYYDAPAAVNLLCYIDSNKSSKQTEQAVRKLKTLWVSGHGSLQLSLLLSRKVASITNEYLARELNVRSRYNSPWTFLDSFKTQVVYLKASRKERKRTRASPARGSPTDFQIHCRPLLSWLDISG